MRPFNGELSAGLAVCAAVFGVVAMFPAGILDFKAVDIGPVQASAAVVFLDARSESEALQAVKDTWRKGSGSDRIYADLMFSELPAMEKPAVLTIETRGRLPEPAPVDCGIGPYLPSCQAPAPVRIPAEEIRSALPFSREELLRIK